jgi:hypothetical protein
MTIKEIAPQKKAIIKFNNGNLAILCSNCKKILKTGKEFNEEENKFAKGEITIPPQYCKKPCSSRIKTK